jgi:DNA-binding beta-propeller fold protein YncE/mono/diheme cytochrome c family protein
MNSNLHHPLSFLHFSASLRLCVSALKRAILALLVTAALLASSPADEPHRSPVDLVLGPNDAWLATVNQTSDTVSLVRTSDGSILDEVQVGDHPIGIALLPDGQTLLVSGHYSGDVTLLTVTNDKLKPAGKIDVGFQPHGIAVTFDGTTAYIACTANAQVAVVDLRSKQVTARIDVGRWPRHLALSPDGSRLAVGTSGDRGVTIVDPRERKALYQEQFVGLNIGHMQVSRDGQYVWFPWMVYRNNPITAANIRLGWVLASRIARVRLDGPARREAMSLDPQGQAIADVEGLALTSDESRLVVSAAGTHELLVYRTEGLPLKDYGGSDHIDPELLQDSNRFHRIELGGRPMGLRIGRDDNTVYVANDLDNSIQVVDLEARKLARTMRLGGPAEPSLARRGEAIFYDARRSLDQWYSCHTCHYEGGTNSVPTDTLNDGSPFTLKTVLPLYNLAETGPWTWHGWQDNLPAALKKSLQDTMLGPEPTDDDAAALLAYLATKESPPNPFRIQNGLALTAAASRGKEIFFSEKAACSTCHNGPHFTDGQIHDLRLGSPRDRYRGFNTPSLRNVYQKVKLLHDGRADSLTDVLTGPHSPEKVSGTAALTTDEVSDLVEYLKSL